LLHLRLAISLTSGILTVFYHVFGNSQGLAADHPAFATR
jgi:hypothetical protein